MTRSKDLSLLRLILLPDVVEASKGILVHPLFPLGTETALLASPGEALRKGVVVEAVVVPVESLRVSLRENRIFRPPAWSNRRFVV